jgi:hypothetical protein
MRVTQTGLLVNDELQATSGLTLFSPLHTSTAYLLNMAGETVHEWHLGNACSGLVYLLENGNLLTSEMSPEGPTGVNGKGGYIREYDWQGNLISEFIDHAQHHDVRKLDNGNLLYIGWETIPAEKAARVQGGIAGTEHSDGSIYGDYIKEVTSSGETVWEWHFQDMEIENYPLHLEVPRAEFAHMNSCFPLPNGDVLVSLRRNSMLAVIDRETKNFNWEMSDLSWACSTTPKCWKTETFYSSPTALRHLIFRIRALSSLIPNLAKSFGIIRARRRCLFSAPISAAPND